MIVSPDRQIKLPDDTVKLGGGVTVVTGRRPDGGCARQRDGDGRSPFSGTVVPYDGADVFITLTSDEVLFLLQRRWEAGAGWRQGEWLVTVLIERRSGGIGGTVAA